MKEKGSYTGLLLHYITDRVRSRLTPLGAERIRHPDGSREIIFTRQNGKEITYFLRSSGTVYQREVLAKNS